MYLRYVLVLAICICCGFDCLKADWVNICPSMTARMVRTVVSSGNDLFAATIEGVYYSSDKGLSWEQRKNGMNNTMVTAAAISGGNVIVGTSGAGVFYSSNKGLNWQHANLGNDVFDIYCLMVNNGKVYAGHYYGISVSEDNGKTWADMGIGDYSVYNLAFADDILFAGTYKNILSYSDGQWTDISGPISGHEVFSVCCKGSLIYAATNKGLFTSIDIGKNWERVTGMPDDIKITKILNYDSLLFLVTEYNGVYFTKNGGYSWLQCNKGLAGLKVQSLYIYGDLALAGTEDNGIYKEVFSRFASVYDFPPSISAISDIVSPPNKQIVIGFAVYDEFPEGLQISAKSMVKAMFPKDSITIEGFGRYRTMRLTPANGKTGSTLITVTVNDYSYSYSLNFNVTLSETGSVTELDDSCPVSMVYKSSGIMLKAAEGQIEAQNIEVYNIEGTRLTNYLILHSEGNCTDIDFSNLLAGVYILTYRHSGKWYYSKIMIYK